MPEIAAIVLAAGKSSRMEGGNKLLLPWKGSTMLRVVAENIKAARPAKLIIITNPVTHNFAESLGVEAVENSNFEKGMTTSIQLGVELMDTVDAYMICPADLPMITAVEYRFIMDRFAERYREDPMVISVPFYKGMKGHPVIFSASYRNQILRHEEMDGCSGIVHANKEHVYQIDMQSDHVVRDIDNRNDLVSSQ